MSTLHQRGTNGHPDRRQVAGVVLFSALLLLLTGWLDYETGTELSFSIFYLAPVALVSWRVSARVGTVYAVLGAGLWWAVENLGGRVYSYPAIGAWNAMVRLGFFLLVARLVGQVRAELEKAFGVPTSWSGSEETSSPCFCPRPGKNRQSSPRTASSKESTA